MGVKRWGGGAGGGGKGVKCLFNFESFQLFFINILENSLSVLTSISIFTYRRVDSYYRFRFHDKKKRKEKNIPTRKEVARYLFRIPTPNEK